MDIAQFIRDHIENVDQLRVILLLYNSGGAHWSMIDLASRLYLNPTVVSQALAHLQAKGLAWAEGDSQQYCYRAASPEIARLMQETAELDRERPVSLLKLIYARPSDIQAFTDAFRLRKDKES
jgi:hypothetical protein